jgi:hypothetical protein
VVVVVVLVTVDQGVVLFLVEQVEQVAEQMVVHIQEDKEVRHQPI